MIDSDEWLATPAFDAPLCYRLYSGGVCLDSHSNHRPQRQRLTTWWSHDDSGRYISVVAAASDCQLASFQLAIPLSISYWRGCMVRPCGSELKLFQRVAKSMSLAWHWRRTCSLDKLARCQHLCDVLGFCKALPQTRRSLDAESAVYMLVHAL